LNFRELLLTGRKVLEILQILLCQWTSRRESREFSQEIVGQLRGVILFRYNFGIDLVDVVAGVVEQLVPGRYPVRLVLPHSSGQATHVDTGVGDYFPVVGHRPVVFVDRPASGS
jgi:hypothetical protein